MTKKIDWQFVIQNTLSVILFCYLFFIGGRGDKIARTPGVFLTNIYLFSIIIILFIYLIYKQKYQPNRNSLSSIAVIVMSLIAVSVVFSTNRAVSIAEYYLWTQYFVLMLFIHQISIHFPRTPNFLSVFIFTGTLFLFGKMLSSVSWFLEWKANCPACGIPLWRHRTSSPNLTGAIATIFILISVAYLVEKWRDRKSPILVAIMILGIYVLIVSSSRGAILGLLAGLIIVVGCKWSSLKASRGTDRKGRLGIILLVGTITLGAMILAIRGLLDPFRDGFSPRFDIWKLAMGLFTKHPLTGVGLYNFAPNITEIYSIPPHEIHAHAHSIPVNLLAEQGLIGAGAILILACVMVSRYYKAYKNDNDWSYLSSLAVIGCFLAHGLVDTLTVEPLYSFTLAIFIGITFPVEKTINTNPPAWSKTGVLIFCTAIFFLGIYMGWSRYPLGKGIETASVDNEGSITSLKQALLRSPDSALINQQLGLSYSFLAAEQDKMATDHIKDAINYLEESISIEPHWAINYANVAALYSQLGNYQKALENIKIASKYAPESALIALNQGVIAEEAGDLVLAEESYEDYLSLRGIDPSGTFWDESDLRSNIQEDWAMNQEENRTLKYEMLTLDKIIENNPLDAGARLGRAKIYFELGDLEKGQQELKLADNLLGNNSGLLWMELLWMRAYQTYSAGDYDGGITLAEKAIAGWNYQSANGPGTYGSSEYGIKFYRQPILPDDLVPQIILEPPTEEWLTRMRILGGWCEREGDHDQWSHVVDDLRYSSAVIPCYVNLIFTQD